MSDTPEKFPEIADLEIISLRQRVRELEAENTKFKQILKDHRLLDGVQAVTDAEIIAVTGLMALKQLQKNGALDLEQIKVYDILHRNLLLAQGKKMPEEKDKKKGKEVPDIGKLLKLADGVSE
jgi:hypothetical protein